LNALQADPTVPPQLVELAAPIAQAMGALHQLERTNQLAPHAEVALGHVRGALAALQAAQTTHPAVVTALEAVAQSLSFIHTLGRMASGPAAQPAPQAAPQAAQPAPAQPTPAQPAPQPTNTAQMPARAAAPQPAPQPAPQAAPHYAAPAAAPQQGHAQPQPMVARDPFAAPALASKPATPSMPVPAPPAQGGTQLIAADLGAHSQTNFYKGLSGNDIIDHGGLFVSTYAFPKIGTGVRLKVSLPGGYEFEANAIVRWTREAHGEAPPGFGAQFTAITPEARQLVYRYVRNREPLFYDDL
jgi:hypothetical protein